MTRQLTTGPRLAPLSRHRTLARRLAGVSQSPAKLSCLSGNGQAGLFAHGTPRTARMSKKKSTRKQIAENLFPDPPLADAISGWRQAAACVRKIRPAGGQDGLSHQPIPHRSSRMAGGGCASLRRGPSRPIPASRAGSRPQPPGTVALDGAHAETRSLSGTALSRLRPTCAEVLSLA